MFPARCFHQSTYVTQGHVDEAPNATRILSCRFASGKKLTHVSSSLIECPIPMALCHMFSDESNQLETYTYVRMK